MKEITPRGLDITRWYTDVVLSAELADYAPVKGCMVIRPYGFAIWENIQRILDGEIKALGHQNAYFPLFIPESFLKKEAEHVKGFAPECAWVTRGGQEELEEPLAIRPTSETIMYAMYAKWIQSYRDLPLLINQWANVVRWEKTTRPFLRTTEFLWQEGHTVHSTEEEAEEEALTILGIYRKLIEENLRIPVIVGRKSEAERFAGALRTYTLEAILSDGKALQAGTSHNLGQGFSRAFNIQFLDKDGVLKHPWQTSWGVSTRLIGAIIMTHGDDSGLILPPDVSPYQAVIVPILFDHGKEEILSAVEKARSILSEEFRVHADLREQYTPGWKFNEWEMRGVPVRIEIGPKDVKAGKVTLVRRDTGEKCQPSLGDALKIALQDSLQALSDRVYQSARNFLHSHTVSTEEYSELQQWVREGFVKTPWCGQEKCEGKVKTDTGATLRCILLDEKPEKRAVCGVCASPATSLVVFARAY